MSLRSVKQHIQSNRDFKVIGPTPAFLGDANGIVIDPAEKHHVFVRLFNGQVLSVFNDRVKKIANLPVMIGYERGYLRILGPRDVYDQPLYNGVLDHAEQHLPFAEDVLNIWAEQFMPWIVLPVIGQMKVRVLRRALWDGTQWIMPSEEIVDLTTHIPSTGARFSLLSIVEGAIVVTDGTIKDSIAYLTEADIPALSGTPLAAVRLYAGQSEIIYTQEIADLVDLRGLGIGGIGTGNGTPMLLHWFVDGVLAIATAVGHRYIMPIGGIISNIIANIKSTGSSGSTIIDVLKNGISVFNMDQLIIPYNDPSGIVSAIPDITSITAGDILTIDIKQVANGAKGLTVTLVGTGGSGSSGSGANTFVELLDTPASYSGSAGRIVVVKNTENGLEFRTSVAQVIFTIEGTLSVKSGDLRVYNLSGAARMITKVHLTVSSAPTGAAIIVDIHKNGTTIFTNQTDRPQIAAGSNTGQSTSVGDASWNDGEYLTMDIDQIGSSAPGSNLVVTIVYKQELPL